MAPFNREAKYGSVLGSVRRSEPNCGAAALNVVYQAAEMFSALEERASQTEAQARALSESAAERLHSAEVRIDTAERSRREIIAEADCKLQAATKALKQAELRIIAAESDSRRGAGPGGGR